MPEVAAATHAAEVARLGPRIKSATSLAADARFSLANLDDADDVERRDLLELIAELEQCAASLMINMACAARLYSIAEHGAVEPELERLCRVAEVDAIALGQRARSKLEDTP